MNRSPSYAEFEHLQDRVDTLENVLCDVATDHKLFGVISQTDLKRALKEANILEE